MSSLTFDPYYMNNMLKQKSHTVVVKIESPHSSLQLENEISSFTINF